MRKKYWFDRIINGTVDVTLFSRMSSRWKNGSGWYVLMKFWAFLLMRLGGMILVILPDESRNGSPGRGSKMTTGARMGLPSRISGVNKAEKSPLRNAWGNQKVSATLSRVSRNP